MTDALQSPTRALEAAVLELEAMLARKDARIASLELQLGLRATEDIAYPGLHYEPSRYETLLQAKMAGLRKRFEVMLQSRRCGSSGVGAQPLELEVFRSPARHFRARARFGFKEFGCALASTPEPCPRFVMWQQSPAYDRVEMTQFPVASEAVNALMSALLAELRHTKAAEALPPSSGVAAALADVRYGLEIVTFSSTQRPEAGAVVTLMYGNNRLIGVDAETGEEAEDGGSWLRNARLLRERLDDRYRRSFGLPRRGSAEAAAAATAAAKMQDDPMFVPDTFLVHVVGKCSGKGRGAGRKLGLTSEKAPVAASVATGDTSAAVSAAAVAPATTAKANTSESMVAKAGAAEIQATGATAAAAPPTQQSAHAVKRCGATKAYGAERRSRGNKALTLTTGRDWLVETFALRDGRQLRYLQVANLFSNPNAFVNTDVLNWVCDVAAAVKREDEARRGGKTGEDGEGEDNDLLELYCGNGNYTVAIAPFFRRVLSVEMQRRLCEAARQNLAANTITNAVVITAQSHKFCDSVLRRKRHMLPPPDDADPAAVGVEYRFDTVLVDPPRTGLDDRTRQLVSQYRHILYISCSPESLRRDLGDLCLGERTRPATHRLERMAVFDHFPFTPHIECGVYLRALDAVPTCTAEK